MFVRLIEPYSIYPKGTKFKVFGAIVAGRPGVMVVTPNGQTLVLPDHVVSSRKVLGIDDYSGDFLGPMRFVDAWDRVARLTQRTTADTSLNDNAIDETLQQLTALAEDGVRFRALVQAFVSRDPGFAHFVRHYGSQEVTIDGIRSVVDSATLFADGCQKPKLVG